MNKSPDLLELLRLVKIFRDDRDWKQFHKLKDLAIGLNIETSELLELFLWKNDAEIETRLPETNYYNRVKEELADVIIYILMISDQLNVDIDNIVKEKLKKNAQKYPVEKAKGSAKKYDQLPD